MRLHILRNFAGLRKVRAGAFCIRQQHFLLEVKARVYQHLLGFLGVVARARITGRVARRYASGHKLRGRHCTGRVEVLDDSFFVNCHRKGLAHNFVVKRFHVVVETQVKKVVELPGIQRQVLVGGDRLVIIRCNAGNTVDVSRLQIQQARRCLFAPFQDELGVGRFGAPVIGVGHKCDVITPHPFLNHVRAGSHRVVVDLGGISAGFFQIVIVKHWKCHERHLRQESRVGRAHCELHRQVVDGFHGFHVAAIVAIGCHHCQARGFVSSGGYPCRAKLACGFHQRVFEDLTIEVARKHIQRIAIQGHKRLRGRGAMHNAWSQLVSSKARDGIFEIFVIQAYVCVGACRNGAFLWIEGILPFP